MGESLAFTLVSMIMDFTELERPKRVRFLTHHIFKGVTPNTSCRRYECMGIL
ncbi:hypothetical protein HPHPH10_0699 [Helicobacter pylori Hp H-10]|nr:hypothetical protein HPHPH10_0699 [Helicobacter pylori Hp H-10]